GNPCAPGRRDHLASLDVPRRRTASRVRPPASQPGDARHPAGRAGASPRSVLQPGQGGTGQGTLALLPASPAPDRPLSPDRLRPQPHHDGASVALAMVLTRAARAQRIARNTTGSITPTSYWGWLLETKPANGSYLSPICTLRKPASRRSASSCQPKWCQV